MLQIILLNLPYKEWYVSIQYSSHSQKSCTFPNFSISLLQYFFIFDVISKNLSNHTFCTYLKIAIFSCNILFLKCFLGSICKYKPNTAKNPIAYKSILQNHLLRNHFRKEIEKLPKSAPFTCPRSNCPKPGFSTNFKNFDSLFR